METLKRINKQKDGKDKILKLIQYSIKLYLIYKDNEDLKKTAQQLSLSRKIFRLGNFIYCDFTFIDLCDFLTDLSDDLQVLVKLNLTKKSFDGNWFWLISIIASLSKEKNPVAKLKLFCDLIFVVCDLNNFGKIQTVAGLSSAVFATTKLVKQ